MTTTEAAGRTPSPRVAITAVYAAYGVIAGIWSGSVPSVVGAVGLDGFWLGLCFTGMMLSAVLAMSIGGRIARVASSRKMLLLAVPAMAISASCVHAAGTLWWFLPALLAFGFSQGLTDLFMNAEGSRIEVELAKPIFSGLHGAVSLCLGLCAIPGSLIAVNFGPWTATPIFILTGAIATWFVARAIPDRPPLRQAAVTIAAPQRSSLLGPLVLVGLAVGFENASEIAALLWSAKLLNEVAPALATIAGIGPAFYSACNALMRLNGDRIRARYGDYRLIIVSLMLAAAGLIGVGVLPGFGWRVVAFAVTGFGTACVIPCLYAIVANSDPNARAARLSFVSMVAGPPRILAPMVFGWVAQHASMSAAFSLCSLLVLLALGLFLASQSGTARLAMRRAS